MDRQSHWQTVYATKDATAVSWYEVEPRRSMDLIGRASADPQGSVIDVGGGASTLVDHLLAHETLDEEQITEAVGDWLDLWD